MGAGSARRGVCARSGARGARRRAPPPPLGGGTSRANEKWSPAAEEKKVFLSTVGSELSNYLVYLLLLEVNDWRDLGCVIDTTLSIDRNK